MRREIKLDGGEITILKAIGFGGSPLNGKLLLDRMGPEMIAAELLDSLDSLLSLGYVLSNRVNVRKMEDVERAVFRINPAFASDLKDAVYPSRGREAKRARRERRG